jgi:hypothetical protein
MFYALRLRVLRLHHPYQADNMSRGQKLVGWQSDSGGRDTLDIIENCLLTILACTWSIQHLNVPELGTEWYWTLGTKIKWAVFTIFFILAHAILEFSMAWNSLFLIKNSETPTFHIKLPRLFRYFCHSGPSDLENGDKLPDWTITHSYFANMGGFYLFKEDRSRKNLMSSEDRDGSCPQRFEFSRDANFITGSDKEANRGKDIHPTKEGNLVKGVIGGRDNTGQNSPSKPLLLAHHFAKFGHNFKSPAPSEEDLKDKSKTDHFTRAIAVLQISQLFLSLIVRRIRHFAFSQLETVTLAFAVCGVITYICYWFKPRDVGRPYRVTHDGTFDLQGYQHRDFTTLSGVLTDKAPQKDDFEFLYEIENDNVPNSKYVLPLLATLAVGFGCMHAIAWKFEFPTQVEKILWRTATLVSILVPPLALISPLLTQFTVPWGDSDAFTLTCLDVMREYYYNTGDESVRSAIKDLTKSYDGMNQDPSVRYKDIFYREEHHSNTTPLGTKLREFINETLDKNFINENFIGKNKLNITSNLYPDPKLFQCHFNALIDILEGKNTSQKLASKAQPGVYPRDIWPAAQVANKVIIYLSIPFYCIARMSIIAVAFSSLRLMPESVYTTTWTGFIPNWA